MKPNDTFTGHRNTMFSLWKVLVLACIIIACQTVIAQETGRAPGQKCQ